MNKVVYAILLACFLPLLLTGQTRQDSAKAEMEKAIKKYRQKDYEESITFFTKAIAMDSTLKDAYIYRGIAKDATDNFAGAIMDFNLARKLDTNDVFIYVERAKTFINLREYEAAEKDFLKIIELNPNSKDGEEALDYLAKIKYKQRKYEPAANYYTRILRFRPNDQNIYYMRGECKFLLNDYSRAIKDFDKAIELDSEHEKAFALRGESKLRLKDKVGACEDLKKAKEYGLREVEGLIKQACN